MLGQGNGRAFASVASVMASDTHTSVSALDDARSGAHVDELLAELVGNAVVAAIKFDVIVDVGACRFALGNLKSQ